MLNGSKLLTTSAGQTWFSPLKAASFGFALALVLSVVVAGASGGPALAQASWYDRLSNSVNRFVDRLQRPPPNRGQNRRASDRERQGRPSATGPINAPPPEAKPGLSGQKRQTATGPIPLEPLHLRLQALESGERIVRPRNIAPLASASGQALMATGAYDQGVVSEPLAPLSLFTEPVDLSRQAALSTEFTPSADGGDEIARLLAAQDAQHNGVRRASSTLQESPQAAPPVRPSGPRDIILTPRGPRPPPGRTTLIRPANAAVAAAPQQPAFAALSQSAGTGLSERGTVFERPGVWAPVPPAKPAPPPGWKAPELQVASLPAPTRGVCGGDSARWATYTAKPAIRQGACGDPRPVLLASIGKVGVRVAPGATVNCRLTAALVRWADNVVAPAARRHLGAEVVSVRNMASYACRRRNNAKKGRLSEHGLANALDIGEFRLSNGGMVSVLDHWRAGGGKQAFLREVHKKSCGVFKTVLGPNADRHHQNHFHFDLARRKSTYCR